MGWIGTLTDIGAEAMKRVISNGTALNISTAWAGTGTVPQVDMRESTELAEPLGMVTIAGKRPIDSGVEISVSITPEEVGGHLIKEIGLFAVINNQNVLIALYQNEDGVDVPLYSEFPDYAYNLVAIWDIDDTGNLTITVDPSNIVTNYTLQQALLGCVAINQGASNAGKVLVVGDDGNISLSNTIYAKGVEF